MDKRRHKKPKFGVHLPQPGKQPRIAAPPVSRSPSWLFQTMDLDGPWSCRNVETGVLLDIRTHLAGFETMSWTEIESAGSHFVSVNRIISDARKRLQERQLDDTDDLFSLRLKGMWRVWGIRDGDRLKILWWDPHHKVCPSEKKHT